MKLSWDLCEFLFNELQIYKYGGIELTTRKKVQYSSRSPNSTIECHSILYLFYGSTLALRDGCKTSAMRTHTALTEQLRNTDVLFCTKETI